MPASNPKGTRRRKAWTVQVLGLDGSDIVFARTASAARAVKARSLQDAWDISFRGAVRMISVRRAAGADVILPARHPVVEDLSDRERHCLLHAFGGVGLKAGYRDHFFTSEGNPDLVRLVERGLMDGPHCHIAWSRPADFGCRHAYFYLNEMGRQVCLSLQPTYPDGEGC
ncbi:hypothetical protein [Zavarzinia sp.]|uniref:hypothetical protein n=1 Tax=Zavarzinia sp. TaxID=2027920 RepID=UPI003BB52DCE